MPKARNMRRALLERMWAEGLATDLIAERMGWASTSPPSTYIAVFRARGYNLPPREPDRAKAIKDAQWPDRR